MTYFAIICSEKKFKVNLEVSEVLTPYVTNADIMIRTLIYILSKVISDDLSFYPAKSPFIKEFEFSR